MDTQQSLQFHEISNENKYFELDFVENREHTHIHNTRNSEDSSLLLNILACTSILAATTRLSR